MSFLCLFFSLLFLSIWQLIDGLFLGGFPCRSSFRKWITRTVELSDQLNKADDYRSIKLEGTSVSRVLSLFKPSLYAWLTELFNPRVEWNIYKLELRDQFFQKWFQSTRRSISLKQRISDYTTDKRKKILEDGFGIWREKRLKKFENEVRNRIEEGTRRNVFEKWRRESKVSSRRTAFWRTRHMADGVAEVDD